LLSNCNLSTVAATHRYHWNHRNLAGADLAALRLLTALISQIPPAETKNATPEQVRDEDQQILARLSDRLRRATHQNLIEALNQENPSEPSAPESEPGGTPGPVPE
jgi:hypothetical protein